MLLEMFCLLIQTTAALRLETLIKNSDDQIESPAKCLLYIARDYSPFKPTTIVYDFELGNEIKENRLFNTVTRMLMENAEPLIITKDLKIIDYNLETKYLVLIFYKSCKLLLNTKIEQFETNFYIIVIEQSFDQCIEIMKKFSENVKSLDVTYFIYDSALNTYIFVTNIPEYNDKTCEIDKDVQFVINNHCNNGKLAISKFKSIFPPKISVNYKECPLKIGLATLFPYSTIKNKGNLGNLNSIKEAHGADVEMLKIITEIINATLDMYYIFREEESPYLHMEFLDFLFNGTLVACAGGLYRIYGDVVEYSGIYSRQTVDWIYYIERDIRSWQSLSKKFNDLYYFLIFYGIYTILWRIVLTYDHQAVSLGETLLYSWGALIGANSLPDARSIKLKMLNVTYLIMCLHLSAYINAQMFSYLTIQVAPQIYKTADELRNSDKTPFLKFATKFFVKDRKYELFANTSKECGDFGDCLNTVLKYKGSTILIDSYLTPFQAATAVNDEARVLRVPESILVVYHEMLIKKDHPLKYKIKFIINKLFEAGICYKLYNDAIGITTVHKSGIFNKNIMSDSYSCTVGCCITLAQSAGVFYIWICGSVCSVFIFLIEILVEKIKRK